MKYDIAVEEYTTSQTSTSSPASATYTLALRGRSDGKSRSSLSHTSRHAARSGPSASVQVQVIRSLGISSPPP